MSAFPSFRWFLPLFCTAILPAQAQQGIAKPGAYVPPLVPKPTSVTMGPGKISITPANKVMYSSPALKLLAEIHTDDIRRTHGVTLAAPVLGTNPAPGDIFIKGASDLTDEAYRLTAKGPFVTIEGGTYDALAFAIMTDLQLLVKTDTGLAMPLTIIADQPYRPYRALQSTIKVNGAVGKGNYYGLPLLKKHIDLCRFYKVRYFQIQTSESQWMFATLKSSNSVPQEKLQELNLYSQSQWDELVKYAEERGVHLIPHNESTPAFGGMKDALVDYGKTGADWLKEIYADEKVELKDGRDGKIDEGGGGVSATDPDYAKAMEIFTRRSYRQFAAGFLKNKLPSYHMGPVYGEGGTSPAEMEKILSYLRMEDPDVKIVFWGGPNPNDPILQAHKKDILVDLYSSAQLHAPIQEYLDAGLSVINASWRPTYILPDLATCPRDIYNNFNLFRMGTDGVFDPIKYTRAKETPQVIGGLFSEWDFASPNQGQLELLLPRLPVWAERIWDYKSFDQYAANDFDLFLPRYKAAMMIAARYMAEEAPPAVPQNMSATKEVYPDHIDLTWLEPGNYPTGYEVYRGTDATAANAKLLATVTSPTYRDADAKAGTAYHYWVKAVNQYGASAFSNDAPGSVGKSVTVPVVYEAFAYPAGSPINGQDGGTGMTKGAWKYGEATGPYTVVPTSLSYSTLTTSGGALSIHPDKDAHGPEFQVTRPIDGQLDVPGTRLWFSFLFQVHKGGRGDAFISLNDTAGAYRGSTNDKSPSVFGLRMGGKISRNLSMDFEKGDAMPARTYFMVICLDFTTGLDRGYSWIDPGPNEPDPADSMANMSGMVSVGSDKFNGFIFTPQGYGSPEFLVDELRLGPTYASVAPGIAGNPAAAVKPGPKPLAHPLLKK